MSEAISQAYRHQIILQKKEGQTLREISESLAIPYPTIRKLWYRYVQKGDAGFQTDYAKCGRKAISASDPVYQATLTLKQKHPGGTSAPIRPLGTF